MTLGELSVRSIVTDKKTRFNNKPIEWLVADHEKYSGTVLLSKDILCCRPFDVPKETYEDRYRRAYGSNRWRYSDIRKWLNDDFFCESFSNRLADLTIPVLKETVIPKCDRDSSTNYFIDGTEDFVFLLSDAETGCKGVYKVLELFEGEDKRKYLTAEVCPGLTWHWWLRSPFAGNSRNARYVYTDGSLCNFYAYYGNYGVRPACVISSSAPVKKRKNGGYEFYWKEVTE